MFKPFSLYIGLRYTRAKRRNHFISFISAASMIGIALGVMVLITVLSVMNGFHEQIQSKIFSSAPHITVGAYGDGFANWRDLESKLLQEQHVKGVAPVVSTQGMLSFQGQVRGVMVDGILPSENGSISTVGKHMLAGSLGSLKKGDYGIVLGAGLASAIGAWEGDKVSILVPRASLTPLGVLPRYKMFKVVGIFQVGGGFGYDNQLALINLHDAQKLLQMPSRVEQLRLKVTSLLEAPAIARNIQVKLGHDYWVSDWTQQFGALFKAIAMEKTMMAIILMLLIAIAAFNLVSTLVMLVTDKQSEIAILRTLGASPKSIMAIFMVQGTFIGLFGTILGVVGGVLLALNAPEIVTWIEHVTGVHFISSSVYFIDFLPSKLELSDVFTIAVASLVLSLLATLYPAWKAARTRPAEALRYE